MVWFSIYLDLIHDAGNLLSAVRSTLPIDGESFVTHDDDDSPIFCTEDPLRLDIGWYSPKKAKIIDNEINIETAHIIALQGMKRVDIRPYIRSFMLVRAVHRMMQDTDTYQETLREIFTDYSIPEAVAIDRSDWIKDLIYNIIECNYTATGELLYMPRPSIFEIKCVVDYQNHIRDPIFTMIFISGVIDNRLAKFLLKSIIPSNTDILDSNSCVYPSIRNVTRKNKGLVKAKNHPTGYFTNIIKPFSD